MFSFSRLAIGNYIVEIEKYENNPYILFNPSANVDPVSANDEHITLKKGESITDTLYIPGYIFSSNHNSPRLLPTGKYRLQIYFNSDSWRQEKTNSSGWSYFKIE